ncbi:MAG TPA: glycosyltransferase family 39 protein [Aggregatilineales bacterium]|nr:glycosyltransferase family 39 protein [Aggregatilineales bacterium]
MQSKGLRITQVAAVLILLGVCALGLSQITRDSLWDDEAWSAWAAGAPRLSIVLERVQADVHPPLYFLLLHGWMRLAGDSVLALRLPSLWMGLIALAGTFAVGARLFDRRTGLWAMVLLGAAGFLLYYTREARMYMQLMGLAALSTYACVVWLKRPTLWRAVIYAVSLAAMLYTHYAGGLVILTHLLWGVWLGVRAWMTGGRVVVRPTIIIPFGLAALLYGAWVPTLLNQLRANPGGPLAIPLPTDWGTVAGLLLILTGATGWLVLLPFVIGRGVWRVRQHGDALVLVVVWLLVTPLGLLALNASFRPVYQVRYAVAMLPAFALLIGYGVRWIEWRREDFTAEKQRGRAAEGHRSHRGYWIAVQVMVLAVLMVPQVLNYDSIWPGKPAWEPTIRAMIAAREPLEPTITDLAPYSPAAYYDRQLGLRQGVSLDLSWRLHSFDELVRLVSHVDRGDAVWVALPINTAKTWHLVGLIGTDRGATYRAALQNMIFYRFERGAGTPLQFRFGEVVRYVEGSSAAEKRVAARGGEVCPAIELENLAGGEPIWSVGLHLVDITGNVSIAQWDGPLDDFIADGAPCLSIPVDAPAGFYHLELSVYNWQTGLRLPVLEDGGAEAVGWGDVLRLAAVDVTD